MQMPVVLIIEVKICVVCKRWLFDAITDQPRFDAPCQKMTMLPNGVDIDPVMAKFLKTL